MKCCERDHDNDGNCDVHSSPGVLREPVPIEWFCKFCSVWNLWVHRFCKKCLGAKAYAMKEQR